MRRTVLAFLALVTGAVLGTGVMAASADSEEPDLVLTAKEIGGENLDHGEAGPTIGDQFLFADDLFSDRKKLGTDGGSCVVTSVSPDKTISTLCQATLSLARGQLSVQGITRFKSTDRDFKAVLPIVGGTGAYRGAAGEFTVESTNQPYETKITLDFG